MVLYTISMTISMTIVLPDLSFRSYPILEKKNLLNSQKSNEILIGPICNDIHLVES